VPRVTDRIELTWLVSVRWTSVIACVAALWFGERALGIDAPILMAGAAILLSSATNLWLLQQSRRVNHLPAHVPGTLVGLDVAVLAGCLMISGGVLNPASIFFLVDIVLAALALGRPWTLVVTALSVTGYGAQLLAPTSELAVAATMHPQIGEHMRGMWWAFVVAALIIGVLVTRLALAIERRDAALAVMRTDADRQHRFMSLASMAAGAAHELSTPLSTIAVVTGELARAVATLPGGEALAPDIALLRNELARSRRLLTDLSGRAEGVAIVRVSSVGDVIDEALHSRSAADRARVHVAGPRAMEVAWPSTMVARAFANLIANALRASTEARAVGVAIEPVGGARVRVVITDHGSGMDPATLARAGEPFFTTRPDGSGLGLGLFVARTTIQQLGGTLVLSSDAHTGTVATCELPRHPRMP
jgi:two-component system sensor histidine kinase RegB